MIVNRVDHQVREHVGGVWIGDRSNPDRAVPDRRFVCAGRGVVHAPVDFPQPLVEFDRDPARAGERGHVLVEPDRVFKQEFLRFGRGVALRDKVLERRDHGVGGEQQIEIAQGAQRRVGIGVPRQPGALERDRCKACGFEPGSGLGQFGAGFQRADAGGAIRRTPAIEDCGRDGIAHLIGLYLVASQPAPRVKQRLKPVLPGHVVERVPIGGGQSHQRGSGWTVARCDQREHQPAQHAQVGKVGRRCYRSVAEAWTWNRTRAWPGAAGRGHVSSSWELRTCRLRARCRCWRSCRPVPRMHRWRGRPRSTNRC